MITLEEMKGYLRVDYGDDDRLITDLIETAKGICLDILRTTDEDAVKKMPAVKTAMLYAVSYLYEHREEADHHALMITLRSLLFSEREGSF